MSCSRDHRILQWVVVELLLSLLGCGVAAAGGWRLVGGGALPAQIHFGKSDRDRKRRRRNGPARRIAAAGSCAKESHGQRPGSVVVHVEQALVVGWVDGCVWGRVGLELLIVVGSCQSCSARNSGGACIDSPG
uniref:Uncharacterized protein n=1 Tax=Arundo donax TaxID=35708 RepID=A0A0A9C8E1_ARUDO